MYGWEGCKISSVCFCPCSSKKEAEYYENRYINKIECVNKRGKFEEKVVKAEFKVKNDDEIIEELKRKKYNIEERKDRYRIRYTEGGESKEIMRRFGKDKEKAFEKIKLEQKRLVNEHFR